MSYTDHIECDTEGATIRYTLDGSDPITTTTTSVREISPGESVFVNKIGTITIRAVGTKEGMENSDEVQKTVTIQVGLVCGGTHAFVRLMKVLETRAELRWETERTRAVVCVISLGFGAT